MKIADNIIKHHLSHVYWVFGTACAGKSSTTKYLSDKYDMVLFDSDNKYHDYKRISNLENQPAMNQAFSDWEEYFNRLPEEYSKWLNDSINEQFDMIVVELLTIPKDRPIIVDCHCYTNTPSLISNYNNVIYLTTEVNLAIDQFMDREEKKDLYELIMSLPEPNQKLMNVYNALRLGHEGEYKRIINGGMKYIIRKEHTKVNEMAQEMAEHFRLV